MWVYVQGPTQIGIIAFSGEGRGASPTPVDEIPEVLSRRQVPTSAQRAIVEFIQRI